MKRLACASVLFALYTSAGATEIVYVPTNPNFGGSPLNGPVLMNIANAINKYKDPDLEATLAQFKIPTSQDLFNQQLNSIILGQIASGLTKQVTNADGTLKPGNIDTGTFLVSIVNGPNGTLIITTLDKISGTTTSITVNQ